MEIRLAVFSALQRCRIKTINYGSNEAFCFYWEQLPLHAPAAASCWSPPTSSHHSWEDWWVQNWALSHRKFLIARNIPVRFIVYNVSDSSILVILLLFYLTSDSRSSSSSSSLLVRVRLCHRVVVFVKHGAILLIRFVEPPLNSSCLSLPFVSLFHIFLSNLLE